MKSTMREILEILGVVAMVIVIASDLREDSAATTSPTSPTTSFTVIEQCRTDHECEILEDMLNILGEECQMEYCNV